MANAAGVHSFYGSAYSTSSPLSLTTGNTAFDQNFEVTNLMPLGTGAVRIKTSSDPDLPGNWSQVDPKSSVSVRIKANDTLDVVSSGAFYRFRSAIQGNPADVETPFRIRVSAGAMS